jgi:hypothetical protein
MQLGMVFSSSARRVRQLSKASEGAGRGMRNEEQEVRGGRRERQFGSEEQEKCQEWKVEVEVD